MNPFSLDFARDKGRTCSPRHSFSPLVEGCEKRIALTASYVATPVVVHDGFAFSTFTNTGTEKIDVGMASYTVTDPNHQALFDSETADLKPGKSVTLEVKIPPCPKGNQIDMFGNQVDTFASKDDTLAHDGVIITTNTRPDYTASGYLPGSKGGPVPCSSGDNQGDDDEGDDEGVNNEGDNNEGDNNEGDNQGDHKKDKDHKDKNN